jgi:glycosyltransferase involved in cell wall biosynthesis
LEDFGIAPVEALGTGRPVIAFAGGGALDTVAPGITGELFAEQTVASLVDVLAAFDARRYDPAACRGQAEQFSAAVFRRKMSEYITAVGPSLVEAQTRSPVARATPSVSPARGVRAAG